MDCSASLSSAWQEFHTIADLPKLSNTQLPHGPLTSNLGRAGTNFIALVIRIDRRTQRGSGTSHPNPTSYNDQPQSVHKGGFAFGDMTSLVMFGPGWTHILYSHN